MTPRMPILRQHHVLEARRQPIDQRHDLIAARHRQIPARAKIILNVDDQEHVARAGNDAVAHREPLSCRAKRRSKSAASSTKRSPTRTG
jgi:hypothetical protein